MKLIGLLSWWDESASWLSAAISSHYPAGLSHLVAVDGAYELYPEGRARSGIEQYDAINATCEGLGISATIHTPQTVWTGNEVEKRSFMFKLGLSIADPDDWFIVIDADHLMTDHDDLPAHLIKTDLHAAELTAWQRPDPTSAEAQQFHMPRRHQQKIRLCYRANPGLRCHLNHFTYVDGENRILWGQRDSVEALDLSHVRIEHRTSERDIARKDEQRSYYHRREITDAERPPEQLCDWEGCEQTPVASVPFDFAPVTGTDALQAGAINVCAKHAKRAHYENRTRLAKLGRDYGREGELLKRHT